MALTKEMIDKLRQIAAESTNENAREGAKAKLKAEGIPLTETKGEDVKKKAEPKPKAESKPKAERKPKSESTPKEKPMALRDYECDELKEQAEERKVKAKAAAVKRANAPKKTQATKNKEAVEKTSERVEKNVEKRVKKGDVTAEEIRKIIIEHEEAIRKLKVLLKRAEEKKMARGGGVDAEELEHLLMKAHGVKEHHCKCGSKMAKGGGVGGSNDRMYSAKKAGKRTSHQNSLVHMKNGTSYYRRNENQYGKVTGGNTYYENRKDHSDKGKFLAQGGDVDSKKRKVVRSQFEEEEFEYGRGGKTKPKMVRTQFEEEDFEYGRGGDVDIVRNPNKNSFNDMLEWYFESTNTPVTKGNLMRMAYETTNGIDTAIPQSMVGELDDSFYFVYDYQTNKFGELVDLREKLKFSNVKVDVTIVVDGDVIYDQRLPDALKDVTFHQALRYVFKHDEVEAFDIRPRKSMAKGGGVGGSNDRMYSAKKAGKRTSHQNSLVQMKNGKSYYRRNENQYGKVEGGGTYYENRKDHSDKGKFL